MPAKKYLLIFAVLLLVSLPVFAQQSGTPRPKLSLAETEFNFGEVKEGVKLTHEFKFKNAGDAPLEIKSVTPG